MQVRWEIRLCSMLLAISLSGCSVFVEQEPPVTWVPLPTVGPLATETVPQPTATSTPVPTATLKPTATPQPSPTPLDLAVLSAKARDAVWMYLVNALHDDRVPAQPEWTADAPQTLEGATLYRYISSDWEIAITAPALAPDKAVYNAQVKGPQQFAWEARVDSGGAVEAAEPVLLPPLEPIEAWRGTIRSLPQGSEFDDYFRRAGTQEEYGITSLDPELTERLAALRDKGRIVQVWGALQKDAADHQSTQIIVERLVEEKPAATPAPTKPASQLVEGWLGVVHNAPAGASYDDYFESRSPVGQFGVAATIPQLQVELAAHRASGVVIRIWGVLDFGVADHEGKRITVTRIEVIGQ